MILHFISFRFYVYHLCSLYRFTTSTSQILKFGNFMLRRTFFQAWPIKDNRHCLRVNCQENFFQPSFWTILQPCFCLLLCAFRCFGSFKMSYILDHQLSCLSASLEKSFECHECSLKFQNTLHQFKICKTQNLAN